MILKPSKRPEDFKDDNLQRPPKTQWPGRATNNNNGLTSRQQALLGRHHESINFINNFDRQQIS